MRVVVAIDSFKGSLSSLQAGSAVKEAVLKVNKENDIIVCPLADGGEGSVDALASGLNGNLVEVNATGPNYKQVTAEYCILENNTAVIEMAAAAGLTLLSAEERNPMNTTTYGVGEIIKDAVSRGCRHFIVGIGGSATNDGGIGMLGALGFDFLDIDGNKVPLCAKGLEHLHIISTENVLPELKYCTFRVACDVDNPLCGEFGCSKIFAPQKGATKEDITKMDEWLKKYASITQKISLKADMNCPGAGAAGGLGFAFLSFLNASLESGVKIIIEETRLEEYIKTADIVVTGEGRLDSQTVMGKAPIGVAGLAKKYGKKVIAFAGCVSEDAEICNEHGIDAYFPILRKVGTLEEALNAENAYDNLKAAVYQVFRLIDSKKY